jgi:hypothetical protein
MKELNGSLQKKNSNCESPVKVQEEDKKTQ